MRFMAGVLGAGLALLLHGGPAMPRVLLVRRSPAHKPGDLRVIVTAAIREPLDAVLAQAQQVVGHPIVARVRVGARKPEGKDPCGAGFRGRDPASRRQ